MTRDEVLEWAAEALLRSKWDESYAKAVRSLKSVPTQARAKSPELTLESNPYDTNTMSHAELADLVFDLHRRWMEAQAQATEAEATVDRMRWEAKWRSDEG